MEKTQLLSMLAFVDQKSDLLYANEKGIDGKPKYTVLDYITELPLYAKFLKTKTTVGMFIPVDEDGDILDYPDREEIMDLEDEELYEHEKWMYEMAKSKCLFLYESYKCNEKFAEVNLTSGQQLKIDIQNGDVYFRNMVYNTVNGLANDPEITLDLSETGYYLFKNNVTE